MELMEFNIDGISLPLTDKKVGNIQLMEHQWEVKNAKEKLIVLDAPTGAGKTLAILLNFIEYNKNTNKSGFFLYPTNELVKDQVEAIANLLDKIGEKYAIISPEGISGEPENANYIIAQATGETLESISGISDEKTQGARLDWLLKYRTMNKSYILLTNIDTLYLVTKMKYAQPHAWRILQEFVNMFGFLSIDEFHLYSGVMYANLVYLLHLYKNSLERVVVATATHNEEGLILVEESLSTKARIIKANPKTNSTNVRKVRHPCKIKLIAAPLNIEPEEVASEVKIKEENDLECECLVIVDSVVKSHLVYEILRDKYGGSGIEVSEISGLVPKGSRKISRITVGTSAIEVGIDFKTKLLVAESKNASSLIQRLGRVARHCEGEAVLFIPALCHSKICEELEKMKKNNTEGKGISYDSFVSVIRKYIDEPEAYYMFAKSKY
ncbi:MAG: type I-D CRISPR-associated helicase Cas3', partial [Thermoplasmata archaeon]